MAIKVHAALVLIGAILGAVAFVALDRLGMLSRPEVRYRLYVTGAIMGVEVSERRFWGTRERFTLFHSPKLRLVETYPRMSLDVYIGDRRSGFVWESPRLNGREHTWIDHDEVVELFVDGKSDGTDNK
jgi:hypothetical protein